jgi:putative nucleotidyltransferase with HDIG domain
MSEIRAVFFDAGDTLIRLNEDYAGPMVDWPELTPVSGVSEALVALSGHFALAVLSNAEDSTMDQVQAAMRRVGLDAFFPVILTARDAGVSKPDPAYFRAGLARSGVPAEAAVMIGDYYQVDVVGAKEAGLRAIWYNPGLAPCPEPHPRYDAEVRDMRDLPEILGLSPVQDQPGYGHVSPAVRGLRLPDQPTCEDWLGAQGANGAEGDLLPHVRSVAAAAFRLAEQLRAAGELVDPLLAHRGGLLHDLAKASAKDRGVSHEIESGRLLRERGLEELARIAERHPVWAPLTPGQEPQTWEERLVYYADRIAEAEGIVTIGERMAAMLRRHPERAGHVPAYAAAAQAMELEIAVRLEVPAGELPNTVRTLVG